MAYEVKMLADSVAPNGVRLSTMQATYPRMVHSEALTHRTMSRNSSSSRAIPIEKMLSNVVNDPAMPVWWGKNQKGMQAEVELEGDELSDARGAWLGARDVALVAARTLMSFGVHKQLVNRVVEPWMWITVIITATDWDNFFALRCHPNAQPEIRRAAEMMGECMTASMPQKLGVGDWHLPLVDCASDHGDVELPIDQQVKLSVARCARVSYLTHDGKRDVDADLALYDRLVTSGHMSPLEHAVKVASDLEIQQYALYRCVGLRIGGQVDYAPVRIGNLSVPWLQHRKLVPGEAVFQSKVT